MNKKGQGVSMTYIIIAALALVVLVVIILFFTGGIRTLFEKQTETMGVTDQQLEIWRSQCKLYCTMEKNPNGNCPNFCNYEQKGWSCTGSVSDTESLGINCGTVSVKETTKGNIRGIGVSIEEKGDRCDCFK